MAETSTHVYMFGKNFEDFEDTSESEKAKEDTAQSNETEATGNPCTCNGKECKCNITPDEDDGTPDNEIPDAIPDEVIKERGLDKDDDTVIDLNASESPSSDASESVKESGNLEGPFGAAPEKKQVIDLEESPKEFKPKVNEDVKVDSLTKPISEKKTDNKTVAVNPKAEKTVASRKKKK